MRTIFAAMCKDLLCLWRDPAALATLFVMPAALVVVISLVQNDTIQTMSGADSTLLVIDRAEDEASRGLVSALRRSGFVNIRQENPQGAPYEIETALAQLEAGKIDAVLVVEAGALERLRAETAQRVQGSAPSEGKAWLSLRFRHDLLDASRMSISGAVAVGLASVRGEALMRMVAAMRGEDHREASGAVLFDESVIEKSYWPEGERSEPLSASEQNLPAWILFAVFFMVLPIASGVIRERNSGTLDRLMSLRVSYGALLSGKIGAYVLIALLQALVIGLVGWYVLPLLGVDRPDYAFRPLGVVACLFLSALAACGAGVALGTVASSEEQASVFGALSVVLLSALGGIMVPLFAMPRLLRQMAVVSPLNWGHQALVKILVDEAAWTQVFWPETRLLIFSIASLALAVAYQKKRRA